MTSLQFHCCLSGNIKKSSFVFQMLLRAKENEVQYLKKEISCLQSEVQSLTKVRFMNTTKYTPTTYI